MPGAAWQHCPPGTERSPPAPLHPTLGGKQQDESHSAPPRTPFPAATTPRGCREGTRWRSSPGVPTQRDDPGISQPRRPLRAQPMREHFPPHVCGGTDGKYGEAARHDSRRRHGPGDTACAAGRTRDAATGHGTVQRWLLQSLFLISGLNMMGLGTGKAASPPEQEGEAGTRWGHELRRQQPEAGKRLGMEGQPWPHP